MSLCSVILLPGSKIHLQKIDPVKDAILASFRTDKAAHQTWNSLEIGVCASSRLEPANFWLSIWEHAGGALKGPRTRSYGTHHSLPVTFDSFFDIFYSRQLSSHHNQACACGVHMFCLALLLRHLLYPQRQPPLVYRRPTGFHYALVVGIRTICKQAEQTAAGLEQQAPYTSTSPRQSRRSHANESRRKTSQEKRSASLQHQNNTFTKTRWSCPCPYPFATQTDLPSVLLVQSWRDDRIPNLSGNHPETHTISHRSARTSPVKVLVKLFERESFNFCFLTEAPTRTFNLVFRSKNRFSSHEDIWIPTPWPSAAPPLPAKHVSDGIDFRHDWSTSHCSNLEWYGAGRKLVCDTQRGFASPLFYCAPPRKRTCHQPLYDRPNIPWRQPVWWPASLTLFQHGMRPFKNKTPALRIYLPSSWDSIACTTSRARPLSVLSIFHKQVVRSVLG